MFCGKLLSFVALATCWFGIEATLEVFFEDSYFENVNPKYIKNAEIHINDDSMNDNTVAVNITFIKEVPAEAESRLVLFGASMGEYVLPTGMDFKMNFCEAVSEPVLLGPFIGALGITENDCPVKPGNYGSQGYAIPTDGLPEEFPPNKYKAIFDITLEKETIITAIFLTTIQ